MPVIKYNFQFFPMPTKKQNGKTATKTTNCGVGAKRDSRSLSTYWKEVQTALSIVVINKWSDIFVGNT